MANKLNVNPIVLDTFSAHVEIRPVGRELNITKIVFSSATQGDIFALEDGFDNLKAYIKQNSELYTEQSFNDPVHCNGLWFDFDEYNAGLDDDTDFVLIYHK